jgi:hypothetical protein
MLDRCLESVPLADVLGDRCVSLPSARNVKAAGRIPYPKLALPVPDRALKQGDHGKALPADG